MYTWYREKDYFYELETCNYICAQNLHEKTILQAHQIWLGRVNIPLW